ncbi:hypothetical protein AN691_0228835 [Klebsiella pneumoniae subsp. pneumoniae]|nr:hypothetical protein AN691_0228835 [Klebsiella pneumoniae subsp. pneumoniae]
MRQKAASSLTLQQCPVDQQQVGLDVAFAVARPIAGKIVVAVSHIQGLIGRQRDQNRLEVIIRAADS